VVRPGSRRATTPRPRRPLWTSHGQAIATPCAASRPRSPKRASPPRRPPLLFDLTSLQREANGKLRLFGQDHAGAGAGLYEKHKALTYPRTDSAHLPEDYLPVAKETFEMLADSGMPGHLAPHAPRR
jgi:DNA topoisomerase-3